MNQKPIRAMRSSYRQIILVVIALTLCACASIRSSSSSVYVSIDAYAMNWMSETLVAQRPRDLLDSTRKMNILHSEDSMFLQFITDRASGMTSKGKVELSMDARLVCLLRKASGQIDTLAYGKGLIVYLNSMEYELDTILLEGIVKRLPLHQQQLYRKHVAIQRGEQ